MDTTKEFMTVLENLLTVRQNGFTGGIEEYMGTLPPETKERLQDRQYRFEVSMAINNFIRIIATLKGLPQDRMIATGLIDGSVEEFFRNYLNKTEDCLCSADKARFICAQIERSLIDKQDYSLDVIDPQSENDPVVSDKRAYWSPKTIKDTKQAQQIYTDWLRLTHIKTEEDTGH